MPICGHQGSPDHPHFMHNTLEFIRMYAVTRADELGDIITAEFSSLLRNNISNEQWRQLKTELEFCRKYSYLCMVRYPKSIAYGFKIDPGFERWRFPNSPSSLWSRTICAGGSQTQDNVISVKVLRARRASRSPVTGLIGRGMGRRTARKNSEDTVGAIPAQKSKKRVARQSIELSMSMNACYSVFGDRYHIKSSQPHHGVTYTITIQDE